MDFRNGSGSFPSRDRRLARARRIVALGSVVVKDVTSVLDPDGDPLVMGAFTCASQNPLTPEVEYEGTFCYNGGPSQAGSFCPCKDWAGGFYCKHTLAACLEAGASEAVLLL